MVRRVGIALLALAGLSACAAEPRFPVRPGEPRAVFEAPKPQYPVRPEATQSQPPAQPQSLPTQPAPRGPEPTPGDDAPPPYKPQPITESQPPVDQTPPPPLRGRQSPGPAMPVRSAPVPALETPSSVTVRPGESLFEVAERVRTPIRAIIDLNGLKPPYDVAPGDTLKIPPPVVYTVKAGDTLISVGRRFSIDPRSLANLNDIGLETKLKAGQRLALPALVKDSEAVAAVKPVAPPVSAPTIKPPKPMASVPTPVAPAVAPAATATTAASETPATSSPGATSTPTSSAVAALGKGKFIWPVKGDILSTFGPKGPGQRNDGVNIAANEGDRVKAAAAGEVVYAGNSVPGFGNLVVVKHPDGWTSLYANLGKMSVKIRSQVAQGQELGLAGKTGTVDRAQVHFEVRYAASPQEKAKPVDPASLLP